MSNERRATLIDLLERAAEREIEERHGLTGQHIGTDCDPRMMIELLPAGALELAYAVTTLEPNQRGALPAELYGALDQAIDNYLHSNTVNAPRALLLRLAYTALAIVLEADRRDRPAPETAPVRP